MSPSVNPSRKYDGSRRQEQAREMRRVVLRTATDMFVTEGYAATTMSAVAQAAGVSVETVYKAIGNKPKLVKACFDVAIAGDDDDKALMDRDDGFIADIQATKDPRAKLEKWGVHVADANRRTGPIQLAVRDAAGSDPAAAEVWTNLADERLAGMGFFAAHLKDAKCLRRGVTTEYAQHVLWAFLAVELWDMLVQQRGWDDAAFARFVTSQLIAALL